jgi:hypothetical protein
MRFAIEGVADGKLQTLDWNQLRQQAGAPDQPFSFRYFQQIDGDIILPAGFTPQRVKVSVSGAFGTQEQRFEWNEGHASGA